MVGPLYYMSLYKKVHAGAIFLHAVRFGVNFLFLIFIFIFFVFVFVAQTKKNIFFIFAKHV